MKTLKRLLALFAALPVFFSCFEEEPLPVPVGYIVINPSEIIISVGESAFLSSTVGPLEADNKTVVWSSGDPSVVTVEKGTIYGVAEGTATVTASATDGSGVKGECQVMVSNTGGSPASFRISPDRVEVPAGGGSVEVQVDANIVWTFEIDPSCSDWVKVSDTKAFGTSTLTFTVLPNDDVSAREGVIEFSADSFEESVKIIQYGTEPFIIISSKEFEVGAEGGEISVEVQSNIDVSASVADGADWISETDSPSTGTFRFAIAPNEMPDPRSARIVFSGGDLREELTVTQAKKTILNLLSEDVMVPEAGGYFEVKLESNVDFDLTIDSQWIIETATRGMQDYVLGFIAAELPLDSYERFANLTFTSSDGSVSKSMTVGQREESPAIEFADPVAEAVCLKHFDANGNGSLSEREAAAVTSLYGGIFTNNASLRSFDEFRFFTGVEYIRDGAFWNCTSLKSITLPDGLKALDQNVFWECYALEKIVIPEGVESIGGAAFYSCSALKSIIMPSSLKSIGGSVFTLCSGLEEVEILAPEPPQIRDNTNIFYKASTCYIYVPEQSVSIYKESPYWAIYSPRITCRGHKPSEFFYSSVDYSEDGNIVQLQQASVGRGINIVFMGDGFTDRDVRAGGPLEQTAREFMEQFFVYEPYKTFRNRFNVWLVKVVSENSEFTSPDSHRALSYDSEDGRLTVSTSTVGDYAAKVPRPYEDIPYKICVFFNSKVSLGRNYCYYFSDRCIAMVMDPLQTRPNVINHELGGHGFAHLADEYEENPGTFTDVDALERTQGYGWYLNVDWRNDPGTVRWAHLLADSRFDGEGLGIFEGGYLYSHGIYRPSENSIMRNDWQDNVFFNAPSREMIYKMIMLYSEGPGWTYDYETFVKADEPGHRQAVTIFSGGDISGAPRRKGASPQDMRGFEHDLPPIYTDGRERSVTVFPDGKVRINY